jgi:hypothetical protein
MGYQVEMISELDGKSLASTAEVVDKYISSKNCTALLIGVQYLQNGSTLPTAVDDVHVKMGTIEIVASNKDGGGTQISIDADDIPQMIAKMSGKSGVANTGQLGAATQANNTYCHFEYWLPFSPDPWSSKYGFKDARVKFITAANPTNTDTYKLYVAALLHDEPPQYYIEMKNNAFTATASTNKDLDLPEGGTLMGAFAMGTTALQDLTTSDAPTIDQLALVVNNSERERISTKCINAFYPVGVYMVASTTVTSTQSIAVEYMFWDLGYKRGYGIPVGRNYKLRVKPLASDAVRMYPVIAHPSVTGMGR